ncbi:MAG: cyclic pyranopterin monophosphate synthase MoaC [Dehalococcoidales bacterium]|nr:cyclic pyranopterin monophosphate synthase MoaC [Dehalococcoidales bacterium]
MIEVYTDGAFNPVTQQGGWAAVILENGQKKVFSGNVPHTTNNRMEITAAMEGLKQLPEKAAVTLYTDSQYLFGCMSRGWERKANRDLWEQIDKVAAARRVKWEWIDQNIINNYQKEAHNMATGQVNPNETKKKTAPELSHIDAAGKPKMVDVSAKPDTEREAIAKCMVRLKPATFALIKEGKAAKGDVLTTAQLAGIIGSKQTPFLIPLCHPLLIDEAKVEFVLDETNSTVEIKATVKSTGKTGVEMEALTAAAIAALTVYDMCKATDKGIVIDNLRLVKKSGGKSGTIVLE